MIRSRRLRSGLVALLLAAVPACAGNGSPRAEPPSSSDQPTGPSVDGDPCATAELEAADIGVDDDTITVEVVADAGGQGSPPLFGAAIDAVKAWASAVNERGGLACREVEVRDWDSRLSPADTAAGVTDACENALAMVGTSVMLLLDATDLATCPDEGFAAIGVPDIATHAVEVPHQCNDTTFSVLAVAGTCPYEGGPRTRTEIVGLFRALAMATAATEPPNATVLVPGETPAAADESAATIRAAQAAGILRIDGEVTATQADGEQAAASAADLVASQRSSLVVSDAHADVLAELRREDHTESVESVNSWLCSSSCYTASFLEHGEDVEGTYVWLPHVPFEESDEVPEIAAYLAAIGGAEHATSTGFAAWIAARLFEDVVETIAERDGYNAITRANLLAELSERRSGAAPIDSAAFGPASLGATPVCFALVQVRNGAFERVHPVAPGTLDCDPANIVTAATDPSAPGAP